MPSQHPGIGRLALTSGVILGLFCSPAVAASDYQPPPMRYYPNDSDMDCMIGFAEVAGEHHAPPGKSAVDAIRQCHKEDRDWWRCTTMDYYCLKYEYEALRPYLESIVRTVSDDYLKKGK